MDDFLAKMCGRTGTCLIEMPPFQCVTVHHTSQELQANMLAELVETAHMALSKGQSALAHRPILCIQCSLRNNGHVISKWTDMVSDGKAKLLAGNLSKATDAETI